MNFLTQLNLREALTFLECLDPNTVLTPGWTNLHCCSSQCSYLAFEPCENTTVAELKAKILAVFGHIFIDSTGYEREYSAHSGVVVALRNHFDSNGNPFHEPITLGMLIASVQAWQQIGE